MLKRNLFLVLNFLVILAMGFLGTSFANEPTFEKKWKIISVGKNTGKHLGFITFNNGQLEGQSTCNLYSAVYELKPDHAIKINRVAVSQLICKAGNKMKIEEDYIAGLEAVSHYKFEDDVLILFKPDKSEVARFK